MKQSSKEKLACRAARLAAIQNRYIALIDSQSNPRLSLTRAVLGENADTEGDHFAETDDDLLNALMQSIADHEKEVKENLAKTLANRKVEKLLQATLEIGYCEILLKQNDSALIIDEYCNLTCLFYDSSGEVGLVNAVLQNLAK